MAAAFEGMKTDKEKDEAIRYGGDQMEKAVVDLTMPHPGMYISHWLLLSTLNTILSSFPAHCLTRNF